MKNIIRICSHMIFWAASLLLCWTLYDSPVQMLSYVLATGVLAGMACVARIKINRMWVFIGSHLATVGLGVLLVSLLPLKTWYIVYLAFLSLWSILLRCIPQIEMVDEPHALYVGLVASLYVFMWLLDGEDLAKGLCLALTILLFLLKMLYDNLQSADWFMEVRNLSEDSDAKKASRISKQISYFYTGAMGVILTVFACISMDGVWKAIKAGVRRLLIAFLSLFSWEKPQATEEELAEKGEQAVDMFGEMIEQGEKPLLLLIFDKIVPIATMIAIVALVIWGMVTLMKKMYGGFYKTRMQSEDRLEVEKLKADKRMARERQKVNEGHSENHASRRIRKIYKKGMNKAGEKHLRDFPYLTPSEQVKRREEARAFAGDATGVRDIYEKARYGKDVATDSDVEKMRGIL